MFTRPGDSVVLRALTEESPMVTEAVAKAADKSVFNSGQTSKEWFARRIKNQRTRNQKVSSYSYTLGILVEVDADIHCLGARDLAPEPRYGTSS